MRKPPGPLFCSLSRPPYMTSFKVLSVANLAMRLVTTCLGLSPTADLVLPHKPRPVLRPAAYPALVSYPAFRPASHLAVRLATTGLAIHFTAYSVSVVLPQLI